MGRQRSKKSRRRRGARRAQRRIRNSNGDKVVAEFVRYEIVDDFIPDPKIERLPRAVREQFYRINDSLSVDAKTHVAELEQLVETHPHIEKFYNYLCIAYVAAGRDADVKRLIVTTFERFPNYLFGIVNYASLCIQERRLDDARAAFQNKFALHDLCGRRKFHLTEYLSFHGLMVRYFDAVGDRQQARLYFRAMREIAPDHPSTRSTAWLFRIPRFIRRLMGRVP